MVNRKKDLFKAGSEETPGALVTSNYHPTMYRYMRVFHSIGQREGYKERRRIFRTASSIAPAEGTLA